MNIHQVKEAKELLKRYKETMAKAQAIALDSDLSLTDIDKKIKENTAKIESTSHAEIAEKGFEEAKKLKTAGRQDDADKLILEIRDILEEKPTDENRKLNILAEINNLFPEVKDVEKAESEEKTREPTPEPTLGDKIKQKIDAGVNELEKKEPNIAKALISVKEAEALAEKISDDGMKEKTLKEIHTLKDRALKPLTLRYLALVTKLGDWNNDLVKVNLKKTKDLIDEVTDDYTKNELLVDYDTTERNLNNYGGKAGEKEAETKAGEKESEYIEDKGPEQKVLGDVKELIEKNIFMSEDKIDAAMKLVSNDATDKEGLKKYSEELEKAMEATVGDVKALIVKAAGNETKIEDIKRSVIDRLTKVKSEVYDRLMSMRNEAIYIMGGNLPKEGDENQRKAYFLDKLEKVMDIIIEDIKKIE